MAKSPAAGKKGMARNVGLLKEQLTSGKPYGRSVNSRGTTNDGKMTPAMTEDAGKSVQEDVSKVKKALGTRNSSENEGIKDGRKLSGLRAGSRLLGRAGLVGAAAEAGMAAGEAFDEENERRQAVRKAKAAKGRSDAEKSNESVRWTGVPTKVPGMKKGGLVRGCGIAKRGFGKAMKGK